MKHYKTEYWAGMNKDQCWCGKKATGKFKRRMFCDKHLEQERDRDEREYYGSRESEDEQHRADYLESVKL